MTVRLKPLAEQVVVVTGASSGIGLATAKLAAARGAKVLLVARDVAALDGAVREIVGAGGTADYAVADVGVLAEVQHAANRAIASFGRIDTWVNNAGVAIYAKLVDTPMDEHERLFRTNYFGAVHGALTAIEHLRGAGGALITVASIAADIPSANMGAYSASKHAIKGYIDSLRIEIVADRLPIQVTLIKPSGIATPIAEHAATHVPGEALIPPPIYDPALVAEAILDAAEHLRREITVGGVGRLQTLLVQHFPAALDYIGGLYARLLYNPARPAAPGDNLERPVAEGRERSARQSGRRFSLYRQAPAFLAAGAVAASAMLLLRRRPR